MITKEFIQQRLEHFANAQDIQILLAIESGSRAWGMASIDSDYDVRFIYARQLDYYLDVREHKEQIGPIMELEGELDLVGWDVRKYIKHIVQSNPNVLEWLQSPIQYYVNPNFLDSIKELADTCFSPQKAAAHYCGIAKGAFHAGYQKERNEWNLKKFGYYLRSLLAAENAIRTKSRNPITFEELLPQIQNKSAKDAINELMALKAVNDECFSAELPAELMKWVEGYAEKIEMERKELLPRNPNYEAGNVLFRNIIQQK